MNPAADDYLKELLAPEPEDSENLCSDLANARRLVRLFGRELRYCYGFSSWYIWTGRLWRKDQSGEICRFVKRMIPKIYAEASRFEDSVKRQEVSRWAQRSEAHDKIKATVEVAKSEPGIPVMPEELDSEKTSWLLNCENGTLDLKTGELRPHNPEDLICRIIPVLYDPLAKAPRFEQFIQEVFEGNEGLIRYVQKMFGYSLTASVRERLLFFLYGKGRNGKSTLMNMLMNLLGEGYAKKAASNLLLERRSDEHPTTIADLRGARVVVCNETSESRQMAEALVKDLTGGDKQKGRFMRQDYFEFTPSHKIFLYGNHKPVIKGRDLAIWDRIKLIPFNARFDGDKEDKTLQEKLSQELPGFLTWCVKGCLLWQQEGLEPAPKEVTAEVENYKVEMDDIGDFIQDHIEAGTGHVSIKAVYERYLASTVKGETPLRKRQFNGQMEEHGFEKARLTDNVLCWKGLRLKDGEL